MFHPLPVTVPVTLDNYRKHKVQTELASFVGEDPIPSQKLLQRLLEEDFFAISSEHGRANRLVLNLTAGLRLQPAWRAYPSVEEFCKANKAYVPCQRDLSQTQAVAGLPLQRPGELLVALKDRTLLRCCDAGPLWTTEIAGVLEENLVPGMLKASCRPEISTGLPMCCEYARTGACRRWPCCTAAHVVDGRPCEHDGCPTHPGLVTITIPFRVAEFYGWLREEDGLPLLGVQQDETSLVMRLPDALLSARTEREFHPELTRFLDHINPRLPSRVKRADTQEYFTDAEHANNVRKYLLAIATAVYRKWQAATDQPTRLSTQHDRTEDKLSPHYPESWRAMITDCNLTSRAGAAALAAAIPPSHEPTAFPVARPPLAPCVATVAPPPAAERSVTDPRLANGSGSGAAGSAPEPLPLPAATAGEAVAGHPPRAVHLVRIAGPVVATAGPVRSDQWFDDKAQRRAGPACAWPSAPSW